MGKLGLSIPGAVQAHATDPEAEHQLKYNVSSADTYCCTQTLSDGIIPEPTTMQQYCGKREGHVTLWVWYPTPAHRHAAMQAKPAKAKKRVRFLLPDEAASQALPAVDDCYIHPLVAHWCRVLEPYAEQLSSNLEVSLLFLIQVQPLTNPPEMSVSAICKHSDLKALQALIWAPHATVPAARASIRETS